MKFGLLTYSTVNLGDEIQSLAARRFLPRIDCFIDRDSLGDFTHHGQEPVALILNGWYSHRPESWPPTSSIRPLLISMHLSPMPWSASGLAAADYFLREPTVRYLRDHGPVGARDVYTLDLLRRHDVPAYFSGCLTLTLPRSHSGSRGDTIVLSELPDDVQSYVRRSTDRPLLTVTHLDTETPPGEARFSRAQGLLDIYETAHCVVTTRLHCVLPCLALGTPVLLLNTGQEPTRFRGLDTLFRHCTVAEFISAKAFFDLDSPGPNSDDYIPLRISLEHAAESFMQDAAGRFSTAGLLVD